MRTSLSLVAAALLVLLVASAALAGKTTQICHIPPGNPGAAHVITVSESAVPAHVGEDGHGDVRIGFLPACGCSCFGALIECQSACDDTDDSDDACGCFGVYQSCIDLACGNG